MATAISLGSYVTFLELAKHTGKQGLLELIKVLTQQNDMFADAHVQVCNDGTGYEGIRQFTQPEGEWRAYNQGVGTGASTSVNFREPTGMLEKRFVADRALFLHQGDADVRRARMIAETMSGMLKQFGDTILSGDRSVDGKRPYGITKRADYNSLSSSYVHDNAGGNASATANKTYMLLVGWGAGRVSIIHPPGSDLKQFSDQASDPIVQGLGIQVETLPDDWEEDIDGTGNKFMAVRNHLACHFGLCIEDARFIQIGVNISTSGVDGIDDFSIHENTMIDMLNEMPEVPNRVFYANKMVRGQLRKRVNSMGNLYHTEKDAFGRWQTMIDDVPIHMIERIPNDSATVE